MTSDPYREDKCIGVVMWNKGSRQTVAGRVNSVRSQSLDPSKWSLVFFYDIEGEGARIHLPEVASSPRRQAQTGKPPGSGGGDDNNPGRRRRKTDKQDDDIQMGDPDDIIGDFDRTPGEPMHQIVPGQEKWIGKGDGKGTGY